MIASTETHTTPTSAPESLTSNENASSGSPHIRMTPSPRSSVEPSRSSSGASRSERSFQSMKGQTTERFIEYINAEVRPMMVKDFEAYNRYASHIEIESYWQEIVLMVWKKSIEASDFDTIHNLTAWCFSFMKKFHYWTRESDFMRGTHSSKSDYVFNTFFMTDLKDEVLSRTITRASRIKEREPQELGKSHGWLQDALDKMSDRLRDSIVCVKVVGMSREDTAQQIGSTSESVRSAVKIARKRIIQAAPDSFNQVSA